MAEQPSGTRSTRPTNALFVLHALQALGPGSGGVGVLLMTGGSGAVTPPHLLARTLTYRLLTSAAIPLGSVLGGLAGARFGPTPGATRLRLPGVHRATSLLLSPVRTLRTLPTTNEEGI